LLKNRRKLNFEHDEKRKEIDLKNDKNIFIQNPRRSMSKIEYYFRNENE
jgi:hypothetical protein